MKIAILTDTHWGVRNNSKYFINNLEEFYSKVFFPTIIEQNVKVVWMLGDTWEYRKHIDLNTLHQARRIYFDRLEQLGIKVIMIYGNHDVYYKNTNEVNSIDFLGKMYPNIHVVKTYEVINFDGIDVGFISWINPTIMSESLEFIRTAPASILCGHFEIKSFEMVKGHVCSDGFDKSIFDRYEMVLSGHFHVMSNDGRINYISNTNQSNWSDYGLKKGFRIFDTETRELVLHENPFWVYGKIAFDDNISVIDFDYVNYSGKIVRVYVKKFETNQQKLGLFLERLQQFAHAVDVFELDETEYNSTKAKTLGESLDMKKTIEYFIDEVVENAVIDKPRLKDYFFELYEEAVQSQGERGD